MRRNPAIFGLNLQNWALSQAAHRVLLHCSNMTIETGGVPAIFVIETIPDAKTISSLAEQIAIALVSPPPKSGLILDLTAVVSISPHALPAFLDLVAATQKETRLVIITAAPHMRAFLLGAKEFGDARLVATRKAAIRELNPSQNEP